MMGRYFPEDLGNIFSGNFIWGPVKSAVEHQCVDFSVLEVSNTSTTCELFFNDYIKVALYKKVIAISLQNVSGGPPASRSTIWKTAKVKHMPAGHILLIFWLVFSFLLNVWFCQVFMHLCKVPVKFFLEGVLSLYLFAIVVYIEDIMSPRRDTKFLFMCWKIWHDLSCKHSNSDLFTCEDNLLFSLMKISCFCLKAQLVFHWCLCNRHVFFLDLFLIACTGFLFSCNANYYFST